MIEDVSPGLTAKRMATQPPSEEQVRHLARIKRAVRRKTSGGVHELVVERQAQIVLLRGRCTSFYCKQIAQTAAMPYLTDGDHLQNEIEVVIAPR